jgi:hypothetical protein
MDSPGPGGKIQLPMTLKGSEYGLLTLQTPKHLSAFLKN